MSRIYSNTPLKNLPQINIDWPSTWNTNKWTSEGEGVLLEAVIKGKSKIAVTDASNKKVKYFVLHVQTGRAHRRKFDKGKEIEPNFSETTKIMTGYLNSSYRKEAKGETDKLTKEQLFSFVEKKELIDVTGKSAPSDTLSLWIEESELDKMDLDTEDVIRIKTKGFSPFIYSIGRVDSQSATVSNYAGGEKIGASWTDKIVAMQSSAPQNTKNDGDEDEEWDD